MISRAVAWCCLLALLCAFLLPLTAGLLGTVLPASGVFPGESGSLAGLFALVGDPRAWPALTLTLVTGLPATLMALVLACALVAGLYGTTLWRVMLAWLPPILAIPHAALAVGLLFLLAPSGWLVRLVSPVFTGWQRPPDLWVVPDAYGLSLILGLVLKEAPFLVLMLIAQLRTLPVDATLAIGRTLGYSRIQCWWSLLLPQLYRRIRLALLIVLAFNLTVVDMALLLGPGHPPTFAALLLSLLAESGSRAAASAGALLLLALVLLAFLSTLVLERLLAVPARWSRHRGRRAAGAASGGSRPRRAAFDVSAHLVLVALGLPILLAVLVLPLWSFAARWRFPDALPARWTLTHWQSHAPALLQPALTTLWLALACAALALLSAVFWLEQERLGRVPRVDGLWYLPLLLPQLTLLFGWQAVTLFAGADGHWITLLHSHWLYTMPYVVLTLGTAWRELDPRWAQAAAVLGAGYWRQLLRVRLPLLARPLAQAAAVAVAVSVAQYLPTLLLGAGRYPTLTTELVTRVGGSDRRVVATFALLQATLPLIAFALAVAFARRRTTA